MSPFESNYENTSEAHTTPIANPPACGPEPAYNEVMWRYLGLSACAILGCLLLCAATPAFFASERNAGGYVVGTALATAGLAILIYVGLTLRRRSN